MTEPIKRTFSFTRTVSTFGVPLILVGTIFLLRVSEGSVFAFFNLQTLFLVAGLTFFMLLGSHGRKFISFLPEALKTLFFDPAGQDKDFAEIAKDGERFSLAAGMIGVIIGLILLLGNLADTAMIGPFMALSLLSMAYALVFAECFFAVVARAYQGTPNDPAFNSGHGLALAFGGIFAFICSFFIMLFPFSSGSEPSISEQRIENPFTEISVETNLGQISEGHTIQFKACLSVSDPRTNERIHSLVPLMRERIIHLILKKEYSSMEVPSAYEILKGEVTAIVNSVLKEDGCNEIPPVIFSEFLIK